MRKLASGAVVMVGALALVACGSKVIEGEDDAGLLPDGSDPLFGNDPRPPPSQGAVAFTVEPSSPEPDGASCPAAAFITNIPVTMPLEALDEDAYLHHVVDGEEGASVDCSVVEQAGWVFSGKVQMAGRSLSVENGTLSEEETGTATITVVNSTQLPTALISNEPCTVSAMKAAGNNLQIKRGSMWGQFSCPAIVAAPSDSCAAEGFFVFENCAQR